MDEPTRAVVWQQADNRCEYCRLPGLIPGQPSFHIDHILPRKHGGTDDLANLALACFYCNVNKGSDVAGLDPNSDHITPLFHPRNDTWPEHFRIHQLTINGRTAKGRTTVRVLKINERQRLQLRSVANKVGLGWPD